MASPLPAVAETKEAGPGEQEQCTVWIVSTHLPIRQVREALKVYREAECGTAARVNPVCD